MCSFFIPSKKIRSGHPPATDCGTAGSALRADPFFLVVSDGPATQCFGTGGCGVKGI